MKATLFAVSLLGLAVPATLSAQGVASVPITPWFDERHGSIRGLVGPAGAARVTDPLLKGLTHAWVGPTGRNALVRMDGQWNWIYGLGEEPTLSAIDGLTEALDSVAWSADGNCAIAIAAGNSVQRICAANGSVRTEAAVEVAGAQRAAASRSGRWIAVRASRAEDAELWIIDAEAHTAKPVFGVCPGAMSFTSKNDTLLVADCGTGELSELSAFAAGPSVLPIGSPEGEPVSAILETLRHDVVALVRRDGLSVALYSREARSVVGEFSLLDKVGNWQFVSPGVYLAFPSSPQGQLQLIDFHREERVFFVPATD